MADLSLVLFDDEVARRWEPFALTRPIGELLFGTMTLRARAERVLSARCAGHLSAEHLVGFEEEGAPQVLRSDAILSQVDRLFLSSRFVPAWQGTDATNLRVGRVSSAEGKTIGWFAPAGSAVPIAELIAGTTLEGSAPTESGGSMLPGRLLEKVWELLPLNPDQITQDIEALFPSPGNPSLPGGAFHQGDHALVIDATAKVEPCVVLDTTNGPIWLDRNSTVRAFTRLVGPAYVGPGSSVLGGAVEAVSIGPVCRVRGELAESICVGYVNKQHEGHMGHGYLGRWVNLGAGTNNSDLKNNYGTIRIWTPDGETDTGEIKMGSLIGDHVKTGIGLLLNTGSVIGAGSNLYGADMPPKYVPPFSWGTGDQLVEYRLDRFLEVAERAMSRRKVTLSESLREQLGKAWERGRADAGTK